MLAFKLAEAYRELFKVYPIKDKYDSDVRAVRRLWRERLGHPEWGHETVDKAHKRIMEYMEV